MVTNEQRLVLLFLGSALFPGKENRAASVFELSACALARVERLLAEIVAEFDTETPSLFLIKLLFLRFLHELSLEADEPKGGTLVSPRAEVWVTIHAVERYVHENGRFRVEDMAREAGCSAGHLHRLFVKACGSSPMAYYQRRRMQHAANLIL
ncbi:MAG: helix-turn-helix domain-containing protein, partial [Acidobacteriota bacterium]